MDNWAVVSLRFRVNKVARWMASNKKKACSAQAFIIYLDTYESNNYSLIGSWLDGWGGFLIKTKRYA